ncbi:hypothetical protein [Pseudoduganella namucuonensis]|uniref:DUF2149 domain-containing protein n=1 Tax=Pseudoduganella namucuonensis TaxID=1035707 RepID=A0A1I7KC55_9BURK|nr:hypothetical protein [Pseudoduganella namucuonensis]SFU94979.1 hypothetical protein SAMN05216552_101634 [Pseudoduganella namucuonensis]
MSGQPARQRMRLYSRLDARFDDSDEDPRASLVNLVDVMLVFACGLIAAIAGAQGALKAPKPVEKGRQIERPAAGVSQDGSGYDRVGEVFRDPKTGQLVLIEPAGKNKEAKTAP